MHSKYPVAETSVQDSLSRLILQLSTQQVYNLTMLFISELSTHIAFPQRDSLLDQQRFTAGTERKSDIVMSLS